MQNEALELRVERAQAARAVGVGLAHAKTCQDQSSRQ
jgi:hypothetical protein